MAGLKMINKAVNNAVKFVNNNLILVAIVAVLLYVFYMNNYEPFRDVTAPDTSFCNDGDCGMSQKRFTSHRAKVERGALEFTGPNQPGALKDLAGEDNSEPYNQEDERDEDY